MTELIEKVKRIRNDNGDYVYRIYREDSDGVTVEKVCYTCDTVKTMQQFGRGKGFRGVHNDCNDCIIKEALDTPRITIRGMALIEEALKVDPSIRFAPKYDRKGRRWLYFYERDEFRRLAIREGWKVARAAYDINNFTYSLLRKELFTPKEITEITAITK